MAVRPRTAGAGLRRVRHCRPWVPPPLPTPPTTHARLPARPPALPPAGIAIGGDAFPGSTLSDHCLRYQNIPQIKMIVVLGEIGGAGGREGGSRQAEAGGCGGVVGCSRVTRASQGAPEAAGGGWRRRRAARSLALAAADVPPAPEGNACPCVRRSSLAPPRRVACCASGQDEYSLVEALKAGRITKPVVAWTRQAAVVCVCVCVCVCLLQGINKQAPSTL